VAAMQGKQTIKPSARASAHFIVFSFLAIPAEEEVSKAFKERPSAGFSHFKRLLNRVTHSSLDCSPFRRSGR
jgi:hypothetical protein